MSTTKTPKELEDVISGLRVEISRLEREATNLRLKVQISEYKYNKTIVVLRRYDREAQQSLLTPEHVNSEFYRGMQVPLKAVLNPKKGTNE